MASFANSAPSFTTASSGLSASVHSQQSQTSTGSVTSVSESQSSQPVLRLRGVRTPQRSIRWAEDVIDNEGLGRKSSKVCCIFHPARQPGESSDESSSSSSSSSDDDSTDQEGTGPRRLGARRTRRTVKKPLKDENCKHPEHGTDHSHSHADGDPVDQHTHQARRRYSPNGYERKPRPARARKTGGSTTTEVLKR